MKKTKKKGTPKIGSSPSTEENFDRLESLLAVPEDDGTIEGDIQIGYIKKDRVRMIKELKYFGTTIEKIYRKIYYYDVFVQACEMLAFDKRIVEWMEILTKTVQASNTIMCDKTIFDEETKRLVRKDVEEYKRKREVLQMSSKGGENRVSDINFPKKVKGLNIRKKPTRRHPVFTEIINEMFRMLKPKEKECYRSHKLIFAVMNMFYPEYFPCENFDLWTKESTESIQKRIK